MTLAVQDLLDAPDLPLKLDAARKLLDLEAELLSAGGDAYPEPIVHRTEAIHPASFPGLAIPHAALFDEAANLAYLKCLLA